MLSTYAAQFEFISKTSKSPTYNCVLIQTISPKSCCKSIKFRIHRYIKVGSKFHAQNIQLFIFYFISTSCIINFIYSPTLCHRKVGSIFFKFSIHSYIKLVVNLKCRIHSYLYSALYHQLYINFIYSPTLCHRTVASKIFKFRIHRYINVYCKFHVQNIKVFIFYFISTTLYHRKVASKLFQFRMQRYVKNENKIEV